MRSVTEYIGKAGEIMSEMEKKALETICKAVPKLSEFQKGRLYGMAEMMEEQNRGRNNAGNDKAQSVKA